LFSNFFILKKCTSSTYYSLFTGGSEADEMAEAEARILKALGWHGDGLITSALSGG
jgi:hypothetical protein